MNEFGNEIRFYSLITDKIRITKKSKKVLQNL
jgi:hypothetical protein